LNLTRLQKCLALATVLLASAACAQGITGGILWQSSSPEIEQSGPTPARLRYRAPEGQRFVLVEAELNLASTAVAQVLRVPGNQIRLSSGEQHYPMRGTFDENGRLLWFVPAVTVLPGGRTRLRAIFQVPQELEDLQLELGEQFQLALPAPQRAPGLPEQFELGVLQAQFLNEAPPIEADRNQNPAAVVEPWPGARLAAVDIQLKARAESGSGPAVVTSDDFFLQSSGRIYRCAGVIQGEPERLRLGPVSAWIAGTEPGGAAERRLRLVFSVDAREGKLWLRLGGIAAPVELSAGSSPH